MHVIITLTISYSRVNSNSRSCILIEMFSFHSKKSPCNCFLSQNFFEIDTIGLEIKPCFKKPLCKKIMSICVLLRLSFLPRQLNE